MNLKKIAASIAALGAVTFAHAANVEFYGSIDNSVSYIKAKGQNGQASMYASNDSSPKLGLTGKEDIGNGHFVRFKLENGYSADTGELAVNGSIFNRESSLTIGGSWGEVTFGRLGTFFTGIGTYGQIGKMSINPCGTNWHDAAMSGAFTTTGQVSNAIVYQGDINPNLTFLALYSNGAEKNDWADEDHLYQLALRYKNGDLTMGTIYTMTDYGNATMTSSADSKKGHNLLFTASKQVWGSTRIYAAYQRVWDNRQIGGGKSVYKASDMFSTTDVKNSDSALDADAFMLGIKHPFLGGSLGSKVMAVHAKWNGSHAADKETSGTRWVVASKYRYDLSKRTYVYLLGSWAHGDGMFTNTDKVEATASRYMAALGMTHRF